MSEPCEYHEVLPDAHRYVCDGFGSCFVKCDNAQCSLEIVRPGKCQCDADCPECHNYKTEQD